jgi:hypothetical protein
MQLRIIALLLLPLVGMAAFPNDANPGGEFVLIGNRTSLDSVDKPAIQAIFRGEQKFWSNRENVIVVLPSSRADFGDRFALEVLQQDRTGLQRHWLALVFQGRARAPVFLDSTQAIIDFVRNTPGAVALVPAASPGIPRDLVVKQRQ